MNKQNKFVYVGGGNQVVVTTPIMSISPKGGMC
jgi:hypothetical protein